MPPIGTTARRPLKAGFIAIALAALAVAFTNAPAASARSDAACPPAGQTCTPPR